MIAAFATFTGERQPPKAADDRHVVPEVVPEAYVVNLIDIDVTVEQRNHKRDRRNPAMPHPGEEPCRMFHRVCAIAGRARGQQYHHQDQHQPEQQDFFVFHKPIPHLSIRFV